MHFEIHQFAEYLKSSERKASCHIIQCQFKSFIEINTMLMYAALEDSYYKVSVKCQEQFLMLCVIRNSFYMNVCTGAYDHVSYQYITLVHVSTSLQKCYVGC